MPKSNGNDNASLSYKLFLLGHPIAHSLSPVMHNAAYRKLGLPWTYSLADCASMPEARDFLAARNFLAINVTTPYKPLAYQSCEARTASAKLAQGANVIVRRGDTLVAYNTDGMGFVMYMQRTGFNFLGKHVAVCGTGPTALAILHASALAGANTVSLIGRDLQRAQRVLTSYVERFYLLSHATCDLPPAPPYCRSFRFACDNTKFQFGSYAASQDILSSADIVVNATPLGMKPNDPAPFDTTVLHANQVAHDVIYAHATTAFIAGARAAGCTTFNGEGMLVAQALASLLIMADFADVDVALTEDELFCIMAQAAGFSLR